MAQLNVRLDDDVRASFDALARARGLNASNLIRVLIDTALGRDTSDRPFGDTTPPSLSTMDRRTLALHHEVLAEIATNSNGEDGEWRAEFHRNMVEVLTNGWTAEYHSLFDPIQPEMSKRECSLVDDILEMFTQLEFNLPRFSTAQRASLGEHADLFLDFRGFDHNDSVESRLSSYANYLIRTDRWKSMAFHFDAAHEYGNSHSPSLAKYHRMLLVWKPIWNAKIDNYGGLSNFRLSLDEIRRIHDACYYPGNEPSAPGKPE